VLSFRKEDRHTARPKEVFTDELPERAVADLGAIRDGGVAVKLKVIAAAVCPVATVAEVLRVAPETGWRWATAYREEGGDGLRPRPKRPRPSKLDAGQKTAVLSWLDAGETAKGEQVHWTLGRLRVAIAQEFNVSLRQAAIWVWLRKEGWRPKVPSGVRPAAPDARPRCHAADAASGVRFRT
jgi:transposase